MPGPAYRPSDATEPPCACDGRELIGLLMHETRTPLNAVRGFAELLLAGAAGPMSAEALDYLRQISRGGRLLESALDHLRELAGGDRPGSGEDGSVDLQAALAACGVVICDAPAAARPVPGNGARWRHLLEAGSFYLRAGEAEGARLEARLTATHEGGLVVTLARADGMPEQGIGALALLLARRLAAEEGVALALPAPGQLRLAVTKPR